MFTEYVSINSGKTPELLFENYPRLRTILALPNLNHEASSSILTRVTLRGFYFIYYTLSQQICQIFPPKKFNFLQSAAVPNGRVGHPFGIRSDTRLTLLAIRNLTDSASHRHHIGIPLQTNSWTSLDTYLLPIRYDRETHPSRLSFYLSKNMP